MIPNSIKKAIHTTSEKMFDVWWGWYYKHFRHAPRYIYERKGDEWMLEHWEENNYDPICFPLPFKINCLGCRGCANVPNPPLRQYVHPGPYKVFFHPFFLNQYEGMFGKQATFELVNDMRQKNNEVDLFVDAVHLEGDAKDE